MIVILKTLSIPMYSQTWSLKQCLDTAYAYSPQLKIQTHHVKIQQEKEKEMRAYLMPKVNAQIDYKYYTDLPWQLLPLSTFNPNAPSGSFKEAQFGVPHNIQANISYAIPLFNPLIYGGIQTVKIGTQISQDQLSKIKEQLTYEISGLYFQLQIIHQQQLFADSFLQNAKKLYTQINILYKQKLAKSTDVNRALLQVDQSNTRKTTLEYLRIQIQHLLHAHMGIVYEKPIDIEPFSFQISEHNYKVNTNIDLKIASGRHRMIQKELEVQKKIKILPTAQIIGIYGTTGFGYYQQPKSFLNFYPISFSGIQIAYPLFDGQVSKHKIQQKKFELQQAQWAKEQTQRILEAQIEYTTLQKAKSLQSIEMAKKQITQSDLIYQQTLLLQSEGLVSLTDVIMAANSLLESQQTYIQALVDYTKADLELQKLTGNLQ